MGVAEYRLDKLDRNTAVLRIEYAKAKGGGGDRGGGGGGVEEEMRKKKMDVRDMEKFSTSVENSEKTIAILGIGWWSPKAKQERGACAVNGQMTKANK